MNVVFKIFYKTILYTSPLWLFCIYLEYRLGNLENSYSYKIKNFERDKSSFEILILGNSEMLKGVNPDDLTASAYNLAHVSQSLLVDALILKKYLNQMPQLKTVILGLSYLSFGDELQTSEEAWRISFYEKYYGIDIQPGFDVKTYSNILRFTPYESLKLLSKNFKADLLNGMQPNGWMKTTGANEADISKFHAEEQAHKHSKSLKVSDIKVNVNALQEIIALLKQKNIRLILLKPPVMAHYLKSLDPVWTARNDSVLNVVQKAEKIEILDCTEAEKDLEACFNDDFNDVNHLNEHGAKMLGQRIRNYQQQAQ